MRAAASSASSNAPPAAPGPGAPTPPPPRPGPKKKRPPEYVPYRMLEVEAAANAVYAWAGEQILTRRLPEERPSDPAEYAAAAPHEQQALRHRAHPKLMQAFLEPEIFDGAVTLARPRNPPGNPQL